eukprot:scaffold37884_cov228-Skeletonema_dohrnii-CCMP3373.AAC.1
MASVAQCPCYLTHGRKKCWNGTLLQLTPPKVPSEDPLLRDDENETHQDILEDPVSSDDENESVPMHYDYGTHQEILAECVKPVTMVQLDTA